MAALPGQQLPEILQGLRRQAGLEKPALLGQFKNNLLCPLNIGISLYIIFILYRDTRLPEKPDRPVIQHNNKPSLVLSGNRHLFVIL